MSKKEAGISVGVRFDGTIDVDICNRQDDDGSEAPEWDFHNLTIEEAEFLIEELNGAIARARPRAAKAEEKRAAEEAKKASKLSQ